MLRQNASLAIALVAFATIPGYSALTHWSHSEQRNHWFGYWFGHDMFTPPFGIYPDMARDAILFGGTDPGRFVPTYMIFCESFMPPSCKPMDPNFDRRDVYLITQNALADGTYLQYLRAQYFRSAQTRPAVLSGIAARPRGTHGQLHHQHPGTSRLRHSGRTIGEPRRAESKRTGARKAFIRPRKFTYHRRMICKIASPNTPRTSHAGRNSTSFSRAKS